MEDLFWVILRIWGKVAWSQNDMFWVLSIPGWWGKWRNELLSIANASELQNENFPFMECGVIFYAFHAIKKASTASSYSAFWLAPKRFNSLSCDCSLLHLLVGEWPWMTSMKFYLLTSIKSLWIKSFDIECNTIKSRKQYLIAQTLSQLIDWSVKLEATKSTVKKIYNRKIFGSWLIKRWETFLYNISF